MDRQQEFVLRTLEERDIRFVRLWFTDVLGTLKSVSVAPAELEAAFDEGIGFDGSAIEGFARVYESDMVAMPDPTTFQVFPFEGGVSGESARMFCDILLPDGEAQLLADPPAIGAVGAIEGWMPFGRVFETLAWGRRHVVMGANQIDRYGNQNLSAFGALLTVLPVRVDRVDVRAGRWKASWSMWVRNHRESMPSSRSTAPAR